MHSEPQYSVEVSVNYTIQPLPSGKDSTFLLSHRMLKLNGHHVDSV